MRLHVEQSGDLREQDSGSFLPRLSRTEMVAIIDALLQAERTLPLIDERNLSLLPIPRLRSLQISLAERLEDLLAEDTRAPEAPS